MHSLPADYCTLWSVVSKLSASNDELDDAHNLSNQLNSYFDAISVVNPFVFQPQSLEDK